MTSISFQDRINAFHKKINEGPYYICVICNRSIQEVSEKIQSNQEGYSSSGIDQGTVRVEPTDSTTESSGNGSVATSKNTTRNLVSKNITQDIQVLNAISKVDRGMVDRGLVGFRWQKMSSAEEQLRILHKAMNKKNVHEIGVSHDQGNGQKRLEVEKYNGLGKEHDLERKDEHDMISVIKSTQTDNSSVLERINRLNPGVTVTVNLH